MLLARGNDAKDLKSLGREFDARPLDEHLVAFQAPVYFFVIYLPTDGSFATFTV